MNNRLAVCFEKKMFILLLFCLVFFAFSEACSAAVNCGAYTAVAQKQKCELKKNYTFDVTTTWPTTDAATTGSGSSILKHWYVSGIADEDVLHSSVYCDKAGGGVISPNSVDYFRSDVYPNCNKDTVYNNYYTSDDLEDDSNINTAEKNFTIKAGTINSAGIYQIEIQWMNNTKVRPNDFTWTGYHSQVCNISAGDPNPSCVICRVGGNCAHPVITPEDLSVLPDGKQNILWFRVVITDRASTPNSIITGWDSWTSGWTSGNTPVPLDKSYRFPICMRGGCADACKNSDGTLKNSVPTIANPRVVDNCAASSSYSLAWTFRDANAGNTQAAFEVEVFDQNAAGQPTIYTSGIQNSAASTWSPAELKLNIAGGRLVSGRTYGWRMRVKDNYPSNCDLWSPWTNGPSFTACNNTPPPVPCTASVTVPSYGCYNTPISFSANVSNPTPISYSWTIGARAPVSGTSNSGAFNYSTSFGLTESGNVALNATNSGGGGACSAGKTVSLINTGFTATCANSGNNALCAYSAATPNCGCDVGEAINFVAANQTYSNYNWTINGTAMPGPQPLKTYRYNSGFAAVGNYSVSLAPSMGGVSCNSGNKTVYVRTLTVACNVQIETVPSQYACPGEAMTFRVRNISGTGPYSYTWTLNGVSVNSGGPASPIPVFATTAPIAAGTYTVGISVIDRGAGNGVCTNNVNFTTINPSFSTSCDTGCREGDTVNLRADNVYWPANSNQWYLDASAVAFTSGSSASYAPATAGSHNITLKVTQGGKTCSRSKAINVAAIPPPCDATFNVTCSGDNPATPAIECYTGTNITLAATMAGATSYNWTDQTTSSGIGSGRTYSTYTIAGPGVHNVKLNVTNGVSSCSSNKDISAINPPAPPAPPPSPVTCDVSFDISCSGRTYSGTNATCSYGENVTFTARHSATAAAPTSYRWALDPSSANINKGGGVTAQNSFAVSDGPNHTMRLTAYIGATQCDIPSDLNLTLKLPPPKWTEVSPHLTIGFILFLLIGRIIILRF